MNISQLHQHDQPLRQRLSAVTAIYLLSGGAFGAAFVWIMLRFSEASNIAIDLFFIGFNLLTVAGVVGAFQLMRRGGLKKILLAVPGLLLLAFMVIYSSAMLCDRFLGFVPDFILVPAQMMMGG